MTTWTEFEGVVRRVTQDDIPDVSGNYLVSSEDIKRYCNYGLDWISNRHAPLKRITLDVDATTRIVSLPTDAYRILNVNSFGVDLSESGAYTPAYDEYALVSDDEMIVGDVNAETVDISYMGEYTWVVNNTDIIPGPRWIEEALLHYTVSRTLSQRAINAGNIGQFDTKSDSGNPEDNPLLRLAEHYMKLAEGILNRRQQK